MMVVTVMVVVSVVMAARLTGIGVGKAMRVRAVSVVMKQQHHAGERRSNGHQR